MFLKRFHPLPLLLIAAGLAAAVAALAARHAVEGRSRAVALVLDFAQLRSLAAATGVPMPQAYAAMKARGVTGIAVTEETLADLTAEGMFRLQARTTPAPAARVPGREYRLEASDPALGERVAEHVRRLVRAASADPPRGERVALVVPGRPTVYFPGGFENVRGTPAGLDPALLAEIRAAGLEPVARINNSLGLTPESLRWILHRLPGQGVRTVVFAGEEVLGYRGLLKETAQAFRDYDLTYGSVEFGKQRGDETLSRLLSDRLARVHSIAPAEMARLAPPEAAERYVRAAEERNIRLNYVRLPAAVTGATYQDSLDYVEKISDGIVRSGLGVATPVPFTNVLPQGPAGILIAALIGAGIGAGAALLLAGLVPIPRGTQALLALLLAAGCALVAAAGRQGFTPGLQAVALLGAIVFPTLAFVLFPQPVGAFEEHRHALVRNRSLAIVPALAEFAAISAVTLAGALMVAGILSELPYLLKIQSFAGIKIANVVPLLLVGAIYLCGLSGHYPSLAREREAVEGRVRGFLGEPVRVWHAAAAVAGLAALALLVARSGNDAGIGVSDLELRFRSLLDRVMGVRPRTKEFLVGHPALLLALAMATVPRWRPWALPLLIVGVIGQVGMLNSFCHLHSPLKLTLLRTVNGLWTGALIGLALTGLWIWLAGRRDARGEPRPG